MMTIPTMGPLLPELRLTGMAIVFKYVSDSNTVLILKIIPIVYQG